jgi:outer membrane lipoprotein SlyB
MSRATTLPLAIGAPSEILRGEAVTAMGVKMSRVPGLVLVSTLVLTTGGCATGLGGGDYTRDQVRGEQSVRTGVVDSVRAVRIEGTRSGLGALGGVGGASIGQGNGSIAGAIAGAIIGGLVGNAAEDYGTRRPGVEVTVLLDSGKMVAITQEADEQFKPGDRVRILSGNGITRVTH